MPDKVSINVSDLISRVQHGFNMTLDEQRWALLKLHELGVVTQKLQPRERRCEACEELGYVKKKVQCMAYAGSPGIVVNTREECPQCHGRGRYEVAESEYEVSE